MDRTAPQRAIRVALCGVILLGCGTPQPRDGGEPQLRAVRYEARLADDLGAMHVRACFDGPAPPALAAVGGEPGEHTRAFDERGGALPVSGDRIELRGVGADECVRWVADLGEAARGSRLLERRGDDLMAGHGAWLWPPASWPDGFSATLEMRLPDGVQMLAPWPKSARGAYVLDRSTLTLLGHAAFGRFEVQELTVAGGRLQVARLDGALRVSGDELRRWLTASAEAVATLYGRFPVDRACVIVVPVGPGRDPVAFGLVRRGGGPAVTLLVRENATLDSLLGDWVAVHELTHFALPLLDGDAAWLSEGIATYYQEILQARAGLQSPLEAWQEIDDGFERGRSVGTDRTLRDEAADMHETRAYRRVYWSGTAFALELDLKLRKATDGRHSLDTAVEGLRRRARGRPGSWEGEALLRAIDEITGTRIASELGAHYAALRAFPDVAPLYDRLGLVRGPDGELAFDDSAPLADLRRAITRPPDPSSPP